MTGGHLQAARPGNVGAGACSAQGLNCQVQTLVLPGALEGRGDP